jgi:hypothetical protein
MPKSPRPMCTTTAGPAAAAAVPPGQQTEMGIVDLHWHPDKPERILFQGKGRFHFVTTDYGDNIKALATPKFTQGQVQVRTVCEWKSRCCRGVWHWDHLWMEVGRLSGGRGEQGQAGGAARSVVLPEASAELWAGTAAGLATRGYRAHVSLCCWLHCGGAERVAMLSGSSLGSADMLE